MCAGPRIGETLGLRWGQVDLLGRRLDVLDAKTDAGKRTVELTPGLAELLQDYKLRARHTNPDDFVFCTRTGKRQNPDNVRNRLLASEAPKGYSTTAVERANEMLLREGGQPLPKITPHSLRRTAISLMLAAGNDPRWVMAQVGHTDPSMTLRVYAQVIQSKQERGGLVDELIGEGVKVRTTDLRSAQV